MLSETAKSSSDINRFFAQDKAIYSKEQRGLNNFAKLVYKVLFQIQTILQTCIFGIKLAV